MSLPKHYSKKAMRRITQRALDIDAAADKAALQGDWKKVAALNLEIEEITELMSKWNVVYDEALETARKDGMKPRPIKYVDVDTPWNDDDPDKWRDNIDTGLKGWSSYSGGSAKSSYSKCAHSHQILTIVDPKTKKELTIQGGSCYTPQGDYDAEILLCSGASLPSKMLPWDKTQFVRFPIVDMQVPDDREEFDKLVDWTVKQMKAGKKVHVGCIGGHGRTGTFLSVLVNRITGQKDATDWLRKNYCKKAVESQRQIDWLHQHYGIDKTEPTKGVYKSEAKTKAEKGAVSGLKFGNGSKPGGSKSYSEPKKWSGSLVATPLPGKSVWGETKLI